MDTIRVQFIPYFSSQSNAQLSWAAEVAYGFHDYLSARGFEFVEIAPDVIWTQVGPHMGDLLKKAECPIVLDDHRDAAVLPWNMRNWIQHPKVKLVMKGGLYDPVSINNEPIVDVTYHGRLIYESNPGAFPNLKPELFSVPEIPEEHFKKLRLVHHFEQMARLDLFTQGPLDSQHRQFDVHFIGHVDYERPTIAYHRRQAYAAIAKLSQKNKSLGTQKDKLKFKGYIPLLRQTKIVVSPWGLGERCHRDYEAALAGCVVIKPNTQWCRTVTGIFDPPCFHCKTDFSDLQEVVNTVLDDWDNIDREMRRNSLISQRDSVAGARGVENCLREALNAS